jgi:hypothetical protein
MTSYVYLDISVWGCTFRVACACAVLHVRVRATEMAQRLDGERGEHGAEWAHGVLSKQSRAVFNMAQHSIKPVVATRDCVA